MNTTNMKESNYKSYNELPLFLNAAEIAVYTFLLFCENRQTFQCWPGC